MEIFQPGLLFMAQDQAAAAGGGCPAGGKKKIIKSFTMGLASPCGG